MNGAVGWIDVNSWDKDPRCRGVRKGGARPCSIPTTTGRSPKGGRGRISRVDPARDHGIKFGCYSVAVNSKDGSLWCSGIGRGAKRLMRLERGGTTPRPARRSSSSRRRCSKIEELRSGGVEANHAGHRLAELAYERTVFGIRTGASAESTNDPKSDQRGAQSCRKAGPFIARTDPTFDGSPYLTNESYLALPGAWFGVCCRPGAPRKPRQRTDRPAARCRGPSAGLPCGPRRLSARASPGPAPGAKSNCRSAGVRATSSNPGNPTPELCSRSTPTARRSGAAPAGPAASRAQPWLRERLRKAGGGTAKQVAGPAVVKLRSRSALRARIGGCQVPGAHRQDPGGEIPQRDPAGQEVPPGRRVLDARGTRAFGGTQEGLAVRSDVGKANGPDGDSGNGEGPAVSPGFSVGLLRSARGRPPRRPRGPRMPRPRSACGPRPGSAG